MTPEELRDIARDLHSRAWYFTASWPHASGLRYVGVSVVPSIYSNQYPDRLLFVEHPEVEGVRIYRTNMSKLRGDEPPLLDHPSDAQTTILIWGMQVRPKDLERLPKATSEWPPQMLA